MLHVHRGAMFWTRNVVESQRRWKFSRQLPLAHLAMQLTLALLLADSCESSACQEPNLGTEFPVVKLANQHFWLSFESFKRWESLKILETGYEFLIFLLLLLFFCLALLHNKVAVVRCPPLTAKQTPVCRFLFSPSGVFIFRFCFWIKQKNWGCSKFNYDQPL